MPSTASTMDAGEETEASRELRGSRAGELARRCASEAQALKWASMDGDTRARIDALAGVMRGEKPLAKVGGVVEHWRVGRMAKVALRDYVCWVKANKAELTPDQLQGLSQLIAAWSAIDASKPRPASADANANDTAALPPHATLQTLHRAVSRHGVGDFALWGKYLAQCKVLAQCTEPCGMPSPPPAPLPAEKADESYVDGRTWFNLDDLNSVVQKSDWRESKEARLRTAEEGKQKAAEAATKVVAQKRRSKTTAAATAAVVAPVVLDADGFVVSPSGTVAAAWDSKPAGLDGYSWSDTETSLVVFIDLSRRVKSQELRVDIRADSLSIKHLDKVVLKRSWARPVQHTHDDTSWFLDDDGAVLRLEVVKESEVERGLAAWPCVFEGDAHGEGRNTRTSDENYTWRQSAYDVTVSFILPRGKSKSDVVVTLQKESIRVYVKGMGSLVHGRLNRAICVSESTWTLAGTELNIILSKLEKQQPWQRLTVGANEITINAAWQQMAMEGPEGRAKGFDDLDREDQIYIRTLRDLEGARASKDELLIEEIEAELESHQIGLETDLDQPQRRKRA